MTTRDNFLDNVEVYSNTNAGTGNVTVGSKVTPNSYTFADAGAVNGQRCTVRMEDAGEIEIVEITLNTGTGVFTRDRVISSIVGGVVGTAKMNVKTSTTIRVVVSGTQVLSKNKQRQRNFLGT